MQYGCIGEHLSHSFSKEIHAAIADYAYELREIPRATQAAFLTEHEFRAINVTIPYKQDVIPFLYEIEENARRIGAVNTIVNRDGKLYGYNTDFDGMTALIHRAGIPVADKKVLILGTGGTSKTAAAVAKSLDAAAVYKVSRTAGDGVITYAEALSRHSDAHVLINTTPRGMFSREAGMPIDPLAFPRLCGVVDAVYNPLRTAFVQCARSAGIPAIGGLYMLVMQAVRAAEIFTGSAIPEEKSAAVYRQVHLQKENIVLTGMPASGKTTIGRLLAGKLARPFIDTDAEIVKAAGVDIPTLFARHGEAAFRDLETAAVRAAAANTGAVIATGGGAILRAENVDALRQNGRIFFLDRSPELLLPTADRPTASSREAIKARYTERLPLYRMTADAVVPDDEPPQAVADRLERMFLNEDFGD